MWRGECCLRACGPPGGHAPGRISYIRCLHEITHIYSDAEKRAQTLAMAELLTPGAAAPATQAVLASTWAYAEADNDVELLWQGHKVPLTKDRSTWAMDLDSAVEGIMGGTAIPAEEKGYDYGQYLQLLLFFKDENMKISRILDLIQINARMSQDGDFLMNEHWVGVAVQVRVNGADYGYEKGIKGFYTLEAAILMPFLILAILSLGYFIKIEGLWENCIHGALDESAMTAMKASNGVETTMTAERVKARICEDNPGLDRLEMKNVRIGYSDTAADKLVSYRLEATERLELPLSFDREVPFAVQRQVQRFCREEDAGRTYGRFRVGDIPGEADCMDIPSVGREVSR